MRTDRPSYWRVRFPSPEEDTFGELIGIVACLVLFPFVLLYECSVALWEWLDDWRRR